MKKVTNSANFTSKNEALKKENLITSRACQDDRQALSRIRCEFWAILALIAAFGMGSMTIANESPTTSPASLVTMEFVIPPEVLALVRKVSPADASAPLQVVFESMGVAFPEGAFVKVQSDDNLVVRNTMENIELVGDLIETHSAR